jgi:hypothetical protein
LALLELTHLILHGHIMRTVMIKKWHNITSLFKAVICPCRTSYKYSATRLITVRKLRFLTLKDKYKNQRNALFADVQ